MHFLLHFLRSHSIRSVRTCAASIIAGSSTSSPNPLDEAIYLSKPEFLKHSCAPRIPPDPHLLLYIIARASRCNNALPAGC